VAQFLRLEKIIINLDNVTHAKVVSQSRVDVYITGNLRAVVSLKGEDAQRMLNRMDDLKA
jgi:hypothetical protein